MVAGENAETAGIIWNRFVKSKLGREIRDRSFDRGARSHFSVGILTNEIISERIVDLLQFLKKGFVLGELFQSRLTRELENANRIVIGLIPKIGMEMAEETPGGRLHRPPQVDMVYSKRYHRQ